MKKIFAYISVAAILAAAVSCGNGKGKQEVSQTEKAEEAPLVSVVAVNKQSVPQQTTIHPQSRLMPRTISPLSRH